jgi:hypothetical protein
VGPWYDTGLVDLFGAGHEDVLGQGPGAAHGVSVSVWAARYVIGISVIHFRRTIICTYPISMDCH